MNDYTTLSREDLIRKLEATTQAHERVLASLHVHEAELEAQNHELRSAQQLLIDSRDRYANLYDFAPIALLSFDPQGCIREINLAGATLLGRSRDALIGKPFVSLVSLLASVEFFRFLREGLAAPALTSCELTFKLRTQQTLVVQVAGWCYRDLEGRVSLRTAFMDVTESKRIQGALEESEARFKRLADAMPQIVLAARPDGSVEYLNSRWHDFTGFKERVSAAADVWRGIGHPDEVEAMAELWRHALEKGEPFVAELRLRDRKTDSYRWHLVRALPALDDEGAITRWFATWTDIDDQKRAQSALEEAHRRKDEFLAMLAHELRTPLAAIANAAQLVKVHSATHPALLRPQQVIERQNRHLARLVDDLLDVARITSGKVALKRETVDVSSLVASTVETIRSQVESHRLRLDVSCPSEPLRVEGDATRLAQVLGNLLNNAIKYTPPDGRIQVTAAREGDQVVLAVRDTGIGISKELLPRIFELFVQADHSLDRSQGGLGIGLALVRRLVEMHGGTVEARSEGLGQGSELVVRLPASTTEQAPAVHGRTEPSAEGVPPLRILVVDDNFDTADSLSELLTLSGHEVETVYDGQSAVSAVATFHPELVLLDLGLPGLDGYAAARLIRAADPAHTIVLVATTGYGQDADRKRTLEAGFDRHLVKPLHLEDLDLLTASIPRSCAGERPPVSLGGARPSSD